MLLKLLEIFAVVFDINFTTDHILCIGQIAVLEF
jgi:hypothetical protein